MIKIKILFVFKNIFFIENISYIKKTTKHLENHLFFSLSFCKNYLIQAIVLYLITKADYAENWLTHLGKTNANSQTKYLHSIYFASTTLLTVGYGDIIPMNNLEVILIITTQIIGNTLTIQALSLWDTSSMKSDIIWPSFV